MPFVFLKWSHAVLSASIRSASKFCIDYDVRKNFQLFRKIFFRSIQKKLEIFWNFRKSQNFAWARRILDYTFFSSNIQWFDGLDHANHIFSESYISWEWWKHGHQWRQPVKLWGSVENTLKIIHFFIHFATFGRVRQTVWTWNFKPKIICIMSMFSVIFVPIGVLKGQN